ncbi:MAG: radical SAM protein [Dehalococcoidales bacterium]|nr:radical SAM protein [Dehalococcoidales bacterium]
MNKSAPGSDNLVISPDWELKKNGSRAALIDRNPHKLGYLVLDQKTILVLSLFDGTNSNTDAASQIAYLLDLSNEQAGQLVSDTITWVNKDGIKRLLPRSETGGREIVKYAAKDLLSPPVKLKHPRRLEVPITFNLTLTHRCQTDCRYCYAERRPIKLTDEMTSKQWFEIIDQAAALKIDRVGLLGGDPLTYRDALGVFEYLVRNNMWFFVSTKCHIDRNMAARLADIGLAERNVQISIDAPNPEIADFLTGAKGSYERAIDSIKNLLANGVAVRAKAVLTPYNIKLAPQLLRFLYGMGVRDMQLIDYGRSHFHHADDLFVNPADSARVAEQVENLRTEFGDCTIVYGAQARDTAKSNDAEPSLEERWANWQKRSRCSGGSSSMSIAPDGRAFLCEQIPQIEEHFVGDIHRQSIMEIWNSKRLLDYIYPARNKFTGSVCHDCDHFDECHRASGHCFRDALFAYGNRYLPNPICPLAPQDAPRFY